MNHRPDLVDYDHVAFRKGFAAGKAGKPSTVPLEFVDNGVAQASWVEGWLMGDSEQDFEESE